MMNLFLLWKGILCPIKLLPLALLNDPLIAIASLSGEPWKKRKRERRFHPEPITDNN
jgi:hypothetical protein